MTRERFQQLVDEALETIPEDFRDAMQNIAIVIEDEPSPEQLDEVGIEPPDTLLGLYEGTPLTERQWAHGNTLPDKITLFQGPIEDASDDEDDVVVAIGETLIHEIGHYFGLSEEEIEAIEERYWRGDGEIDQTGRELTRAGRPRKRFGQHFLRPGWARRVVAAIDPRAWRCVSRDRSGARRARRCRSPIPAPRSSPSRSIATSSPTSSVTCRAM